MKYFIVTDVHSFFCEMRAALDAVGFDPENPEHIFVSLGDLLDRGPDPWQCLNYVMNTLAPERRILICGNHEDLIEDIMCRRYFVSIDASNGTADTVYRLAKDEFRTNSDMADIMTVHDMPLYNDYIKSLKNFHETQHGIFVHGWIPCIPHLKFSMYDGYQKEYEPFASDWRTCDLETWKNARWYNGMEAWDCGVREPSKTIFCGHWHTSWARAAIDQTCDPYSNNKADYLPWERDGIVALDACTAFTHFCNCYVFEDEPLEGENI